MPRSTDDDPLTSVAVSPRFVNRYGSGLDWTYSRTGRPNRNMVGYMTVVSEGWGKSDAPDVRELELVGGDTVTVPANSYQRRVKPEFYCEDIRFSYGSSATFRKLNVNDMVASSAVLTGTSEAAGIDVQARWTSGDGSSTATVVASAELTPG